MKKILLAFAGMLFFSHLVYANYYWTLVLADSYGNNTVDYNTTWSNHQNLVNKLIKSDYRKFCTKTYGPSESAGDPGVIVCDVTDETTPYFWDEHCGRYKDPFEYATLGCTDKGKGDGFKDAAGNSMSGRRLYQLTYPDGWRWKKEKRLVVHSPTIYEMANDSWLEYPTNDQGRPVYNTENTFEYTVLTSQQIANNISWQYPKCYDHKGVYAGGVVTCSVDGSDNNIIRCSRKNCPVPATASDGYISVEYWAKKDCDAAHNRMPNTSYSCSGNRHETNVNWDAQRWDHGWGYRDGARSYIVTGHDLKCKKYYSQWDGDKKTGKCMGNYWLVTTDAAGGFNTRGQYNTYDITGEVDSHQSSYGSRVTCSGGAGHDDSPGTGTVTCTCKSNTFWTEDRCKSIRGKHQYCQNSGNSVCGWELKSCSGNRYNADSANTCKLEASGYNSDYCASDSNVCPYYHATCNKVDNFKVYNSYTDNMTNSGAYYCDMDQNNSNDHFCRTITNNSQPLCTNQYAACTDASRKTLDACKALGRTSQQACRNNGSINTSTRVCNYERVACTGGGAGDTAYTTYRTSCPTGTQEYCVQNFDNNGNAIGEDLAAGTSQCAYKHFSCNPGTYADSSSGKTACEAAAKADEYCKDQKSSNGRNCRYKIVSCAPDTYSKLSKDDGTSDHPSCQYVRNAAKASLGDDYLKKSCSSNQGQSGDRCPYRLNTTNDVVTCNNSSGFFGVLDNQYSACTRLKNSY